MLVISGLGVGGAERVVVDLADAYAARGHEVWLVSLSQPASIRPSHGGVRLVQLNITRSLFSLMRGVCQLAGMVRRVRPYVVHSHMVHSNILMRVLRLITPMPRLVSTAHSVNEEGKLRMLAYRLTDRLADFSTNVSQEAVVAFERVGAVPHGRMIPIHNGIRVGDWTYSAEHRTAVRAELGVPESCRLVVAVGRFAPEKDYPNLLKALAELNPKLEWLVAIAGDGPLRPEMERRALTLGLSERVRFLGIRSDIRALLSAADLFVLSSAWEGFPMVIGEAMACERVIVATDCGGVAEFLGSTGFLVRPGDPRALSEAMVSAMTLSDSERGARGRAARARVAELYSLDNTVERWLELYAKCGSHVRLPATRTT